MQRVTLSIDKQLPRATDKSLVLIKKNKQVKGQKSSILDHYSDTIFYSRGVINDPQGDFMRKKIKCKQNKITAEIRRASFGREDVVTDVSPPLILQIFPHPFPYFHHSLAD